VWWVTKIVVEKGHSNTKLDYTFCDADATGVVVTFCKQFLCVSVG
jgi:hypothetical protein